MFLYNEIDSFFIMMVGLSGSGKSTKAEELSKTFHATVFSSDKIRMELFGDSKNVYTPRHHKLVFEELHKRVISSLKNGENVIYDATNLSSKNRVDFLLQISKEKINCRKFAFLMDTDFQFCMFQNQDRKDIVSIDVLNRQYDNFEIPSRFEGFDQVVLNSLYSTFSRLDLFQSDCGPKFNRQKYKEIKKQMKRFNQQSKHHKYNLWKHSKLMAKYCKKDVSYQYIDRIMLFHDIGKLFTKKIKDDGEACYYHHENIGTYYLLRNMDLFKGMTYDEIIDGLYLINHHMLGFALPSMSEKKKLNYKLRWYFTSYNLLKIINKCDILASN